MAAVAADGGVAMARAAGDECPPLLVRLMTEHATAPTRGTAYSAGYDLSR